MNIKMQSYYHESMKMMDQHGEKAEFVDKRVSLFKVHFTNGGWDSEWWKI